MTSRERVITALSHKSPDRLPIDFGGTPSSGIHIEAYAPLLKELNIQKEGRVVDLFQFLTLPDEEVRQHFRSDVYLLTRKYPRFQISVENYKKAVTMRGTPCLVPEDFHPETDAKGDWLLRDAADRVIARMPKGGYYFDMCNPEHAFVEEESDLDRVHFSPLPQEELDYLSAEAARLYHETDYAIVGAFGGSIFESCQRAMGFEKFLMDLLCNPEVVQKYIEKLTENHMKNLEAYLGAVGDKIQVIQFSDDLGSQDSLLLSRDTYRSMIMPYHKMMYQYVKKNYPNVKVLLHSCGAIKPLMGDLIEAGVDALNPVQISAAGMDPRELKREFGSDITFWGGGADLQGIGKYPDLDSLRAHVRDCIDAFSADGGFIFAPVHNIQDNVTPKQIEAIYQTAFEYHR